MTGCRMKGSRPRRRRSPGRGATGRPVRGRRPQARARRSRQPRFHGRGSGPRGARQPSPGTWRAHRPGRAMGPRRSGGAGAQAGTRRMPCRALHRGQRPRVRIPAGSGRPNRRVDRCHPLGRCLRPHLDQLATLPALHPHRLAGDLLIGDLVLRGAVLAVESHASGGHDVAQRTAPRARASPRWTDFTRRAFRGRPRGGV